MSFCRTEPCILVIDKLEEALQIEHDGVDGASAGGTFAAGGEEAGVGVGVDTGGEDMAVGDTGPDQCQADGFPEVDVEASLHRAGYLRATVRDNRSAFIRLDALRSG